MHERMVNLSSKTLLTSMKMEGGLEFHSKDALES